MATTPQEASTIVVVTPVSSVAEGAPTPSVTYTAKIIVQATRLVAIGTFDSFLGDPPSEEIAKSIRAARPVITGTYTTSSPTRSPSTAQPSNGDGGRPPLKPDNPSGGNGTQITGGNGTAIVQSPSSSSGTDTGAIAGAAVGCLVAGLLLGFAIAFFFLRRRKQAEQNGNSPSDESKAYFAAVPSPPAQTKVPLDKFLLDSSPDKEIASELRSLGTLIQQHVENNYHLQPIHEDPRVLAMLLVQLGVVNGSSLTPDVLAQLTLDPSTRYVALQHVISQVLFTSVDVSSRSPLSMLPAPLAAFLRSIPQKEAGDKSEGTC